MSPMLGWVRACFLIIGCKNIGAEGSLDSSPYGNGCPEQTSSPGDSLLSIRLKTFGWTLFTFLSFNYSVRIFHWDLQRDAVDLQYLGAAFYL